jgi:membrane dipeptidase
VVRDMFGVARQLREEHGDDEAAIAQAYREWWSRRDMPRGSVGHVVDHIDHIVRVAGVDHAGLGSDFDGISVVPEGLEDVSKFPAITEELLRRRYSEEDILKILGGNVLRALAGAGEVARRLQNAAI